ncbi:histone deacetylase complex subunit SAP18-like [Paramacrobiotus metropolitanus]|uniref:histone deacetylase complex subunit SAP18-like n=1 Tax=Paramacrobiotus metropolitanus TaxID=2943436 RepID=UPI00244595BD|nr:histone deacetylase complex subunit SAP18-like [Paramacrobiotus metropolitanus]
MAAPRIESQVATVILNTERERRVVDRESTCPILIRTFIQSNTHLKPSEINSGNLPNDERLLLIHTWVDATLRELTNIIREVRPEARRLGTRLSFHLLTPEQQHPGYRSRNMGEVFIGSKPGDERVENKTLEEWYVQAGDVLDVCIHSHMSRGPRNDRDRDREREGNRTGYRDRENRRR